MAGEKIALKKLLEVPAFNTLVVKDILENIFLRDRLLLASSKEVAVACLNTLPAIVGAYGAKARRPDALIMTNAARFAQLTTAAIESTESASVTAGDKKEAQDWLDTMFNTATIGEKLPNFLALFGIPSQKGNATALASFSLFSQIDLLENLGKRGVDFSAVVQKYVTAAPATSREKTLEELVKKRDETIREYESRVGALRDEVAKHRAEIDRLREAQRKTLNSMIDLIESSDNFREMAKELNENKNDDIKAYGTVVDILSRIINRSGARPTESEREDLRDAVDEISDDDDDVDEDKSGRGDDDVDDDDFKSAGSDLSAKINVAVRTAVGGGAFGNTADADVTSMLSQAGGRQPSSADQAVALDKFIASTRDNIQKIKTLPQSTVNRVLFSSALDVERRLRGARTLNTARDLDRESAELLARADPGPSSDAGVRGDPSSSGDDEGPAFLPGLGPTGSFVLDREPAGLPSSGGDSLFAPSVTPAVAPPNPLWDGESYPVRIFKYGDPNLESELRGNWTNTRALDTLRDPGSTRAEYAGFAEQRFKKFIGHFRTTISAAPKKAGGPYRHVMFIWKTALGFPDVAETEITQELEKMMAKWDAFKFLQHVVAVEDKARFHGQNVIGRTKGGFKDGVEFLRMLGEYMYEELPALYYAVTGTTLSADFKIYDWSPWDIILLFAPKVQWGIIDEKKNIFGSEVIPFAKIGIERHGSAEHPMSNPLWAEKVVNGGTIKYGQNSVIVGLRSSFWLNAFFHGLILARRGLVITDDGTLLWRHVKVDYLMYPDEIAFPYWNWERPGNYSKQFIEISRSTFVFKEETTAVAPLTSDPNDPKKGNINQGSSACMAHALIDADEDSPRRTKGVQAYLSEFDDVSQGSAQTQIARVNEIMTVTTLTREEADALRSAFANRMERPMTRPERVAYTNAVGWVDDMTFDDTQ